ncbi:hypothetical protein F0244_21550 [Vibrio mediterranei]|nr:hypothetical protein [Vibrio mediterranei]
MSIKVFKTDSQRMVLFIPSLGSVFKVVRFSGSVAHYLTRRCTSGKQNGKYLRFSNRGSHYVICSSYSHPLWFSRKK